MASNQGPILRTACPMWDASEQAGEDLLDQFLSMGVDLGLLSLSANSEGDREYAATDGLLHVLGLRSLVSIQDGEYRLELTEINQA